MTAKDMANMIGCTGYWTPSGTTLEVPIVVSDARQRWGRTDLLISPCGGEGTQWVARDSLRLYFRTKEATV